MEDQFSQFERVRVHQSEPHSSGSPALQAFTSGRCHTMAVALQIAGGGDLVVITPKDDPNYLIHAGVYRDGKVVDAHGYSSAHDWAGMWRTASTEFDGDFRRVSRAELMAMIPERGGGDDELAAAAPLARALVDAAGVDLRAWRSSPPAGSFSYVTEAEPDLDVFTQAIAAEPRAFVQLVPAPSRSIMQGHPARMAGMTL